jgi:hypothetical protein
MIGSFPVTGVGAAPALARILPLAASARVTP